MRSVYYCCKTLIQILNHAFSPASVFTSTTTGALEVRTKALASFQCDEQLKLLAQLFSSISKINLELDFLKLASHAMVHLQENGRSNLIYQLCMCVGTLRRDSLLPVKHMPTGLIEYIVKFVNTDNVTQVSVFLSCM